MDVGEHVHHHFIDASPVLAAVEPLAILSEGGELEGFGFVVPAKVCTLSTVMEAIVERDVLGGEVCPNRRGLAGNAGC